MTDKTLKQIGHGIRWGLEISILWFGVFPETGFWTAFTLTMLTLGTEWFWINPKDWKK